MSDTDLIRRLASLGPSPADPASLSRLLSELISSGTVADSVREMLQDPATLAELGGRSYAHANGFDKVVLATHPQNHWKLRLHVWPQNHTADQQENIHNHRWDFASAVLVGSLDAEYFAIQKDEDGPLEAYEYFSPETSSQYDFDLQGSARATTLDLNTLTSDAEYGLAFDVFHRVALSKGPAATLVLQGPVKQRSTTVVREPGSQPVITRVTRMSPGSVRDRLSFLGSLL